MPSKAHMPKDSYKGFRPHMSLIALQSPPSRKAAAPEKTRHARRLKGSEQLVPQSL